MNTWTTSSTEISAGVSLGGRADQHRALRGVTITAVSDATPASAAGLRPGI